MHAELRLGMGMRVSRKRVAGLLRLAGRPGIGGNTHRKRRTRPMPAPHDDRVQRRFLADVPNRLWCTDITEHPTATGKVYCCAELVVDAPQMATWRRRPEPGAIVHADRGRNSHPGCSGTGYAKRACSARWAASHPRWTTR